MLGVCHLQGHQLYLLEKMNDFSKVNFYKLFQYKYPCFGKSQVSSIVSKFLNKP